MIGSDGILGQSNNNRGRQAASTRVLGRYVREEDVLSLVDGLAE